MRSLVLASVFVVALSACTTVDSSAPAETANQPSAPPTTDAASQPQASQPTEEPAGAATSAPSPTTESTAVSSTTSPEPAAEDTVKESEPVLTETAAAPDLVVITSPANTTVYNIPNGVTDQPVTATATGAGNIDWFVEDLDTSISTFVGSGSSVTFTLVLPLDDDDRAFTITADSSNPNAGQDSIQVALHGASDRLP